MINEPTNLEKINSSKNKIGYDFENYNKIMKYFKVRRGVKEFSRNPLEDFLGKFVGLKSS